MVTNTVLLVGSLIFLLTGCRPTEPQSAGNRRHPTSLEPSAEFVVTNGSKLSDLIQRFGSPATERDVNGAKVIDFLFPASSNLPPDRAGVSVWVRNGEVFQHVDISGRSPLTWDRRKPNTVSAMKLRLQTDTAEFQFDPVIVLPVEFSDTRRIVTAHVEISTNDVLAFAMFTRTNVGAQVKVFASNEFVSEFLIREPIETNRFQLTFEEPGVTMDKLFRLNTSPRTEGN
jgi:hypothetical protein